MLDTPLLHDIANAFIESAERDGFNGIVASALLRLQTNPEVLRAELSALLQDGQITASFSSLTENIHIKRLPDFSIEKQLKRLSVEPLETFCLYPTASAVQVVLIYPRGKTAPSARLYCSPSRSCRFELSIWACWSATLRIRDIRSVCGLHGHNVDHG